MAILPFDASSGRLNDAASRSRQLLAGFTPGQKAVTVLVGGALLFGTFFLATRSSAPSYATLYANLQTNQAGQVTQKLSADGIPYQLQNGGSTVLVPVADVNQERISLAEAGLPTGGTVTFQTLASTGITSSQFVQTVDYQQALEGQLASTIESIQGIQSADVSLVMPSTSTLAIGNTQTPTASVLVNLSAASTLSIGQVQGIVHLVASAVPSLSPSNVTVVDNNGNVLSAPGVDATASSNAGQASAYDSQLAASLTALLTRVVGPSNGAVQVHANMNFNQSSTVTNGFVVGKTGKPITVPTSQSTTRQTFTGNGAQAAGVLGATQPASPTNQNGKYVSTQTQTSNAIGSVTQTVKQAPGQITHTAIAVLVNSTVVKKSQLPALQSLIATAAGLNLKAGDTIVVTALPFAASPKPPALAKASMMSSLTSNAPVIGTLLLILLMFFLSLRAAKKRKPVFESIPVQALDAGRTQEPATGELPAVNMNSASMLNPASTPVANDVDAYIQASPDEVAQLMRTWSQEGPAKA